MVYLFPTNMILPFCQKSKKGFSRNNTLEDDISGIIEKDDVHPRKYGTSPNRKTKVAKKVHFYKNFSITLSTYMETIIGIFIYSFPIKKPRKLNM